MKVCSKCKVEKDESEFYKEKSSKSGFRSICKICNNQAAKEWCEKNKDKAKEMVDRYYKNNKDKIYSQQVLYREKNRESILKRTAEYREKNKTKLLEKASIYRENNREKICDRYKEFVKNNKNKIVEYNQKYRKSHPETILRLNRDQCSKLNNNYVRQQVAKNFPKESITPELIEWKRISIKIKRLIKEKKQCETSAN